ncbi:hypothetical protein MANES_18G081150v8 [Manihot esculenta]|uniref:Uncharacterized protein n=1 Tax=Manihot esculenta TaxID=3983 RepID=A0ACB7FZS1_MANES|nr:hypothetical protein MANES_18G081150v8 [Manihot esculenta]
MIILSYKLIQRSPLKRVPAKRNHKLFDHRSVNPSQSFTYTSAPTCPTVKAHAEMIFCPPLTVLPQCCLAPTVALVHQWWMQLDTNGSGL